MQNLARDGYTEDEVKEALHAAVRQVSFEYHLLDTENLFQRQLTNVKAASVAVGAFDQIKRTARFTIADDGSIDFLVDRIKPFVCLRMPELIYAEQNKQQDFSTGTLSGVKATSRGLELTE